MHQVKRNTPTKNSLNCWLFANVQALIAYAKTDSTFAESLAYHVQQHEWKPQTHVRLNNRPSHLIPQSQPEAVAVAHWLLKALDKKPALESSRAMLATWAQDYESPKDFVIGIVGVAIIGPTLGILDKKKDHAHLQVIVDQTWYEKSSSKEIAQLVLKVSNSVVAKELRMAGGNAYILHPDTAEWCLGKPHTQIYLANDPELHLISTTAEAEHLSHHTTTKNKKPIAVALSPAINDSFVQEFEVTEPEG